MAFVIRQSPSEPGDEATIASSEAASPVMQIELEELYHAHRGQLHRFFTRRGAGQDADDLVQECFVRFARSRVKMPNGLVGKPEAYLNRIALNLLREKARVAVRRSTAFHVQADEVPLAGSDPLAALEARDLLERLQASLSRLSLKSRSSFVAHRRDGMSYKEISMREGLSEEAVKKRISKAIAHVARLRATF